MKATVSYSNNYRKIIASFKDLPRETEAIFLSACKRDALTTARNFHDGIKTDSLGLKKLKDGTIARKKTLGFSRPEMPLYGKGDEVKKRSYMNMLRIRTLKGGKGFTLHPSTDKHWTGEITLDRLWDIHEHGVIIHKKSGFVHIMRQKRQKGEAIRIPPRPALQNAFNKTMRERNVPTTTKIIKYAIVQYINTKQKKYLTIPQKFFLQGLKKYEIVG
jgi:hypothetical protein